MIIMHWADVEAHTLAKKELPEHIIATGITPSGDIHVGNMREILTADGVTRAVRDLDVPVRLAYIGDTFDPLRKRYPFLNASYEDHVGKPLSEVPCICNDHDSYADHFLEPFLEAVTDLGVDPEVHLTHEMYEDGTYETGIRKVMENSDRIKNIIQEVSGREMEPNWSPYNAKCSECGKFSETSVLRFEDPFVIYICNCSEGERRADIRRADGKLRWRVDWPVRWTLLAITCEPFGKDHAAAGGSYDSGKRIIEEIFEMPAPHPVVYEWIHLKGKGAMSSSSGVAIPGVAMLKMTPPEVFRFLILRSQPNKHIDFDPGLGRLHIREELNSVVQSAINKKHE